MPFVLFLYKIFKHIHQQHGNDHTTHNNGDESPQNNGMLRETKTLESTQILDVWHVQEHPKEQFHHSCNTTFSQRTHTHTLFIRLLGLRLNKQLLVFQLQVVFASWDAASLSPPPEPRRFRRKSVAADHSGIQWRDGNSNHGTNVTEWVCTLNKHTHMYLYIYI